MYVLIFLVFIEGLFSPGESITTENTRGVGRCLSGDSGYLNKQYFYHYETVIWKNTLLLLITFSENIASIVLFISNMIYHYLSYHRVSNNTHEHSLLYIRPHSKI